MSDTPISLPIEDAILRAELALKVGQSVVVFAEDDGEYELSYLLARADGVPLYSFTNKARNETLTFDAYSIPVLLSHLN